MGGFVLGVACRFSISGYLSYRERKAERSDVKIFEREPGNGRVAARLILNSGTVEEAELVIMEPIAYWNGSCNG